MKTSLRMITAVVAMAGICAGAFAQSPSPKVQKELAREYQLQAGPGIAISGTQQVWNMPQAAQDFLEKNYKGIRAVSCKEDFIKRTYHVVLKDGTSIIFNKDGKVVDIIGGNDGSIKEGTIADILPAKAVSHLRQAGVIDEVNTIRNANEKGFGVILLNDIPPEMIFDVDGTFVIVAG